MSDAPSTPLAARLARRIAASGPISLADYMAECLLDPTEGYYSTREPFGQAGDFITAPEISQIFGEVLALALGQAWVDRGSPNPACLAEIGPGRGTLMADVLRVVAKVPGMAGAVRPWLIEASGRLRAVQEQRLAGPDVAACAIAAPQWAESLADLPQAPLFLLANEFLDALPIRQFQRQGAGWAERMVGLSPDGGLAFGLGPAAPLGALAHRLADTRAGDLVEICPALPGLIATLAARLLAHGGVAIFIDYGGWISRGDTFQALRAHQPVDPLADPGRADLTAHVDFAALAQAARAAGLKVTGMTTQGVLLERLGITARAQALARNLTDAARADLAAAHRRLTHPAEMGNLFKAIALYAPGHAPPPPGFDPPL